MAGVGVPSEFPTTEQLKEAGVGVPLDSLNKDQLKTFSDFLQSYNKLSSICFADCVNDFTTRTVSNKEDQCAANCMEKYLKMNQRISQRFQEFQVLANENAMAMMQKANK